MNIIRQKRNLLRNEARRLSRFNVHVPTSLIPSPMHPPMRASFSEIQTLKECPRGSAFVVEIRCETFHSFQARNSAIFRDIAGYFTQKFETHKTPDFSLFLALFGSRFTRHFTIPNIAPNSTLQALKRSGWLPI
jgi:hypothetical protein